MATATFLGWVASIAFLAMALVGGYFVLATRRISAQAERAVPASGRFMTLGAHRIHYVDQGEGRPILFIHGLGAQLHHFRHPLFPELADFRCVALDRPGSGYSARPGGFSGGLVEQADLVAHFITELGLEKPLVVGHSLGGAVALALAENHPDTVSGLVLLSPLTHLEDELRPEFRSLYIKSPLKRRLMAETLAVPTSLKYAPQKLAFLFSPQAAPKDYGTAGGGFAGLRPSHFYATSADMVAIERDLGAIQARYGELDLPVGVMFGTADRVLDYRLHGAPLAGRIKDVELDLVDGLGHMPQFVEAKRVADLVRRIAARALRTPADKLAG
ncbi:pimeloyl-ACP methyl ester carboxylesterase [Aminobacter lissarensis]|uniref:Pimeloyl-ACP methyl ester carboxylesterase n=1 Tax=Aminobacter carboxidus TaxID=376165 RepID=A0A8E2BE89_9HYPH|nr:alpha/beta fold hydrolase [Aminobacter lissarensis]MBB6466600.1 pimeloyl-ACP methyl ester carboxylesterase [Aminobacter lissarensis]